MILTAYCIYDVQALQYHSPWFQHTDGMAVRAFSDLANSSDNNIGRHPRDFTLFECGSYDDSTGRFTPTYPLRYVADAASLVRHQPALPLDAPQTERQSSEPDGPAPTVTNLRRA